MSLGESEHTSQVSIVLENTAGDEWVPGLFRSVYMLYNQGYDNLKRRQGRVKAD